MQVRAEDLSVRAQRAIRPTILERHQWTLERRTVTDACMNLVTAHGHTADGQSTCDIAQLLGRLKHGIEVQPTKSAALAGEVFQPIGIAQPPSEHLKAAANTDQLTAVAQVALQVALPTLCPQPCAVGAYALRARQYDHVGGGQVLAGTCEQ